MLNTQSDITRALGETNRDRAKVRNGDARTFTSGFLGYAIAALEVCRGGQQVTRITASRGQACTAKFPPQEAKEIYTGTLLQPERRTGFLPNSLQTPLFS